jgi:septal ring factor EnvC (AmiA/AmiB activator)
VADTPFAKLKGKLIWPVRGKLLAKFGTMRHQRFGTLTFNSGIDIRAREGREIVASAAGQVEFVDWLSGYGKTVILSHGNGYYTVYGHASRILAAPGDRVGPGDVIALAGSTESLRGDCLHFELRRGGRAVDPIPWLRRR